MGFSTALLEDWKGEGEVSGIGQAWSGDAVEMALFSVRSLLNVLLFFLISLLPPSGPSTMIAIECLKNSPSHPPHSPSPIHLASYLASHLSPAASHPGE